MTSAELISHGMVIERLMSNEALSLLEKAVTLAEGLQSDPKQRLRIVSYLSTAQLLQSLSEVASGFVTHLHNIEGIRKEREARQSAVEHPQQ